MEEAVQHCQGHMEGAGLVSARDKQPLGGKGEFWKNNPNIWADGTNDELQVI